MTHVVLLGGGYVGIEAYKHLARGLGSALRRGDVRVTVVTPVDYHTFHGFTSEVLGGLLPVEDTLTPLQPLMRHATLRRGTATRVDLAARTVAVDGDDGPATLRYDHLVLGTGSHDPFDRIPGLAEHAWRLKHTLDMQRFHAHLGAWLAALERHSEPMERRIVVVGGGFSGVESAAAIVRLLRAAQRRPALRRHRLGVSLVVGHGPLLAELRPRYARLARYAERAMRRLGVRLIEGERVAEILPNGVRLTSGGVEPADLVLATAGGRCTPIPGTEALPWEDGRLRADRFLRVAGESCVWTGGDVSRVAHPVTGDDCPTNALWAMKHGARAGGNIARAIRGRPPRPFSFRGLGQSASLAVGDAVTELHTVQVTGALAWVMRLGFFLWYMPTVRGALRVARDLVAHRGLPHLVVPHDPCVDDVAVDTAPMALAATD